MLKVLKFLTVNSMSPQEESFRISIGKRFGHWEVIDNLDEGAFGKIYKVRNIEQLGRVAALKAEASNTDDGAAIKLEIAILKTLSKRGVQNHVPELYRCKKRKSFDYMIVTLLGKNFRTLRLSQPKEHLSKETWCRLAIQCLYAIKLLHDVGFIHRDIKPANFVMGHESDPFRARVVHILDFGMAREFAFHTDGNWVVRKARSQVLFRGTYRYCSLNMHMGKELGRVDDIWSMMYMLIELNSALPWEAENDKDVMAGMKQQVPDSYLFKDFPEELHGVLTKLRNLNYYNKPDYFYIYTCLIKLMKRLKVSWNDCYDWETKTEVKKLIKRQTSKPAYEDAKLFFKSDPLNINSPPPLTNDHSVAQVSKVAVSYHT